MNAFLTLAIALAQPPVQSYPHRVSSLAFSPDGVTLAASVGDREKPGTLIVRNIKTGTEVWKQEFPKPIVVAYSPDGSTVFAGGEKLIAFDAKTGKQTAEFAHDAAVTAIAFGPADRFATASANRMIRIWDAKSRAELFSFDSGRANSYLAFSSDGTRIIGGSPSAMRSPDNRTSISSVLWDAKTGKEVKPFDDGFMIVAGLAFSPDGKTVLRGVLNDGTVSLHDAETGTVRTRLRGSGGIDRFAFGMNVAVTANTMNRSETSLLIYRLRFEPATKEEATTIDDLIARFDAEAITDREKAAAALIAMGLIVEPQLKRAMTDSSNAEIRLRSRKALIHLRENSFTRIAVPAGRVSAFAVTTDGDFAATGSPDGIIRVVDLKDGKVTAEWKPGK